MSGKNQKITVQGSQITVVTQRNEDYISLTDIARSKDSERTDYVIQNWLRNRNTIEFLGIWEQLNNPVFNPIEFDGIRKQSGLNSFLLTSKRWIEATGAIGLTARAGRYRIHTDAIRANLIPPELSPQQINFIYASEADLLNMALFGKTAKQWRDENLGKNSNIRDEAVESNRHSPDETPACGEKRAAIGRKEQRRS